MGWVLGADFGFEILVFFAGEAFDFALDLAFATFLAADLAFGLEGETFSLAMVFFGGMLIKKNLLGNHIVVDEKTLKILSRRVTFR